MSDFTREEWLKIRAAQNVKPTTKFIHVSDRIVPVDHPLGGRRGYERNPHRTYHAGRNSSKRGRKK